MEAETAASKLLTPQNAAEYLQVTQRFLQHDRSHRRKIPFVKVGHLVRYTKTDLDEYINASRVAGGA